MDCAENYYRTNIRPLVDKYILEDRNGFPAGLCVAAAGAFIVSTILWRSSRLTDKGTKKKRAKKQTKKEQQKPIAMTLEMQIESVRLRLNDEYKEGVLGLIDEFDKDNEKDVYKRNYYNEMLLKLLIELDGIDLVDVAGDRKLHLKEDRKAVIKEIQTFLKKLDKLK